MEFKDFIYSGSKKMILTDKEAAVGKLVRRYAKSAPVSGVKVVTLSKIAANLVFAYKALLEPENMPCLINEGMATMRMFLCLKDEKVTFLDKNSKNLSTAGEILNVLNKIRFHTKSKAYEEANGRKILGLKTLLADYERLLIENTEMDQVLLYQEASSIIDQIKDREDAKLFLLTLLPDFAGTNIASLILDKLNATEESFYLSLLQILELKEEKLKITESKDIEYSFYKCYGVEKEVEHVLDGIEQTNYGDVAIIYPNAIYENVLRAKLDSAQIPYTFPKGFSACNTEFIGLMLGILEFVDSDFSINTLYSVLDNGVLSISHKKTAYKHFLDAGIGYGRDRYLSYFTEYENLEERNKDYDPFYQFLKSIILAFDETHSYENIYHDFYELVKENTLDFDSHRKCLLDMVRDYQHVLRMVDEKVTMSEFTAQVRAFLKQAKCKQSEDAAAVSILPYGKLDVIDRKKIFVVGLSSDNVESIPMESPVLCDRELEDYIVEPVEYAKDHNIRKREAFLKLLELSNCSQVIFSYSYFDMAKLLDISPSILYMDFQDQAKSREEIEITYALSDNGIKRKHPTDKIELTKEEKEFIKKNFEDFSVTSLQDLLSCPMKFYYQRILKLPNIGFYDRKADQWLNPGVRGNVFHHVMENYVKRVIQEGNETVFNEEVFQTLYEEEIAQTIKSNPVPSTLLFEEEKKGIEEVLISHLKELHEELNHANPPKKIYRCEFPFRELVYEEENEYCLKFNGFIDRVDAYVEKTEEGNTLYFQIFDYKTGSLEKKKTEIAEGKQIQHYIYAKAILKYARENIAEFEEMFQVKIDDVKLACFKYIMPYEDTEKEIPVDMSEEDIDKLPDLAEQLVLGVVKPFMHDHYRDALEFAMKITQNNIRELAKKDKDKDFCEYCNYKKVCRI